VIFRFVTTNEIEAASSIALISYFLTTDMCLASALANRTSDKVTRQGTTSRYGMFQISNRDDCAEKAKEGGTCNMLCSSESFQFRFHSCSLMNLLVITRRTRRRRHSRRHSVCAKVEGRIWIQLLADKISAVLPSVY